jgi:histidine triad (HIT) family protein
MSAAGCVFCRIVRGEAESYRVLEDELTLAFLDTRPLFPGHCLVIPRAHHETLPDLPADLLAPVMASAQLVCRALGPALGADGAFVAINNRVSQSVPHLHVHVIPRRFKDGLKGFFWPRGHYRDAAEAGDVQAAVRAAVDRLRAP